MDAFARFAAAAAIPLGLLNLLVTLVAGIWLAVLGQWGTIGYGLVALAIPGVVALAFAFRPGLLLYPSGAALHEKGHRLRARFLRFLSVLYRVAVLSVWCLAVLFFFARRGEAGSVVPTLLWSYGLASGSIAWMPENELQGGGGKNAAVSTLFAHAAYVVAMLAILLFGISLMEAAILLGVVMATGLPVQLRSVLRSEADEQAVQHA